MKKHAKWWALLRPKTLLVSVGPILLGLGLSLHATQGHLQAGVAVLTLLCGVLLQAGANLANDYFDFKSGVDSQRQFGPVRFSQSGLIPPRQVQWAFRLVFALAFLLGIFLMVRGGTVIILMGILSLIFAYAYTGGPYPLSHYGWGEVLAFVFFGPVAVAGTYYLQTLSGDFSGMIVLCGMGPGFLAATVMAINNVRDLATDRRSGKNTFAVRLGEVRARYLCVFLMMGASLIPLLYMVLTQGHPFLVLPALLFLPFFPLWRDILHQEIGPSFNTYLMRTGQFSFLYNLLFAVGVLL